MAVTKVTGGSPAVARALLDGGATALADSRLVNIARMRAHGIEARYWLLRAPSPSQADEVVKLADVSLESEIGTVRALSDAAARAGADHGVVCMVDVGDLREGVLPPDLVPFVEQCDALPGIHVEGVGVNLTCYGAIMPTCDNLGQVAELAAQAEAALGRPLVVSGGNSGSLPLALRGELPAGITSLRVGESILLGLNTLTREPLLPELHLDAFLLTAPVIECLRKPSKPIGVCAQDMMGNVPEYEDRGTRRRAILALGRQDVVPELIRPLDPRVAGPRRLQRPPHPGRGGRSAGPAAGRRVRLPAGLRCPACPLHVAVRRQGLPRRAPGIRGCGPSSTYTSANDFTPPA